MALVCLFYPHVSSAVFRTTGVLWLPEERDTHAGRHPKMGQAASPLHQDPHVRAWTTPDKPPAVWNEWTNPAPLHTPSPPSEAVTCTLVSGRAQAPFTVVTVGGAQRVLHACL